MKLHAFHTSWMRNVSGLWCGFWGTHIKSEVYTYLCLKGRWQRRWSEAASLKVRYLTVTSATPFLPDSQPWPPATTMTRSYTNTTYNIQDIYEIHHFNVEMIQDNYTTLLEALTKYQTTRIILHLYSPTNGSIEKK